MQSKRSSSAASVKPGIDLQADSRVGCQMLIKCITSILSYTFACKFATPGGVHHSCSLLDSKGHHISMWNSSNQLYSGNSIGKDGKLMLFSTCFSPDHFHAICPQNQGQRQWQALDIRFRTGNTFPIITTTHAISASSLSRR